MKKIILLLLVCCMIFVSCGGPIVKDGTTYQCYGFLDSDTVKKPNVQYESSVGNAVLSVILIETIVIPIWLLGYKLYCPISVK